MFVISTSLFSMELNLERAVDIANKNNRSLKTSEIDVKQQELSYKEAYKEGLPTVSLESDYTGTEERTNNKSDGYFENGVVLNQSLYSGGETYYGIKETGYRVDLYETLYQKDTNNIRLEVVENYVKIQQLEKELEVYNTSKKEKTEELERQKEFYNLGMIDKSEILKVESSLYQTESSIIDVENSIKTQKIELKKLLGISLDKEINLDSIEIVLGSPEEAVNLESDQRSALSDGLEITTLDQNLNITQMQEKASKSDFLPTLDFEFAYESLDEESFSSSMETNDWQWRAGVSFKWEIFNFGSSMDSYEKAKNETEKASIEKEDGIEELKKNITSAYLNMETLHNLIDTKKKAYETSEEAYEIDKEKYSNRLIDTVDYLITESALREAEVEYINSQLDYYLAYETYLNLIK